jgi:hypothetical protein
MKLKLLSFLCFGVIASIVIAFFGKNEKELYTTYESPSGDFIIEVYRQIERGVFPGQSGDSPGFVVLKDTKGKILNRSDVEMVQLVYEPDWSEDRVRVKLLFDWELPNP